MKLKRKNLQKWENKNKKIFISILLLRPLLETTRFDLKKLCQIWNLPVYPDVTNQNFASTRNRIRLQLLPILRFFFNPQIDTIFTQFAQINLQEQDYLNYLTTRLIKNLFSKKKVLRKKALNSFEDSFYRQKLCFSQVRSKENLVKLKNTKSCQGDTFSKTKWKEKMYFAIMKQRKPNFYQTKVTFYERANLSFHVLYKFEFQNQPLFLIPLAIQKRIGKKLIEYFLNKKVNFSHVEHLMKYLKNSQTV